jgi:hypothetical protein
LKKRALGILAAAAVVVVASGFVPLFAESSAVPFSHPAVVETSTPYHAVETVQSVSFSTSTSVTTGHTVTTVEVQVMNLSSIFLDCDHWLFQETSLVVGNSVNATYSASGALDMFVFTKAQYSTYVSSGGNTTSPNAGEILQQPSGTIDFSPAVTGNYYFVFKNPPVQGGCQGVSSVGLYRARAYYNIQQTAQYFVTSTAIIASNVTVTRTATQYSVTSYTTVSESTGTQTCSLGWLQAIFFGCG